MAHVHVDEGRIKSPSGEVNFKGSFEQPLALNRIARKMNVSSKADRVKAIARSAHSSIVFFTAETADDVDW